MAARWNAAPPARFQDKLGPVVDRSTALQSIGTYAGVAAVAAVAGRYGCAARGSGRLERACSRGPQARERAASSARADPCPARAPTPPSAPRPPVLRWLRVPGVGYLSLLLGATVALSVLGALTALARWRESRARGAA
jgi:hypothetical protein